MVQYAHSLGDVKKALGPGPLQLDDLQTYFEETTDARDPHIGRRFAISECLATSDNVKVLLFGHAGCGKSTELMKLQEEVSDHYAFVSFSLIREAQLSQISTEALLVLIVEAVVRASKDVLGFELDESIVKAVYDWFTEAFEIKEQDLQYTLGAGTGVSTKNTLWGKLVGLSAYLKADIKTGSRTIHKAITKENKRLSELAYHCNLVIKEARIGAAQKGRELVLIIEDLDKVNILPADEIFISNPAPLADLECKAVFTAPIWLLCNPRSVVLENSFRKIVLPMIHVKERWGGPSEGGRATLRSILRRRLDVDRLIDGAAEGEALTLAIEKTGGVLRHLFDILITAATTAEYAVKRKHRAKPQITRDDVRYGLDQLKSELVRRLGVLGLPPEYEKEGITVQAMTERLRDLATNPRKMDSDLINLLLLQAHAVIEYNGEGWHAAHPLIAEHVLNPS